MNWGITQMEQTKKRLRAKIQQLADPISQLHH